MKIQFIFIILILSQAYAYNLVESMEGNSFFDHFDFNTFNDPTHGYVDYVSKDEAFGSGLVGFSGNQVIIKADNSNTATGRGRKSVRITSKNRYRGGLYLFDIQHMPTGCGTWPAYWTVGADWPNNGEIDIIEGVNTQSNNLMTLHTRDGCTQNDISTDQFSGHRNTANCYIHASGQYDNQGCTISANDGTYGAPFNSQQGGVIATEWDENNFVKTWIFMRNQIPSDITSGNPNPSSWGKPIALFGINSQCSADHLNDMNFVINLTFCGDWAGAVFEQMCPGKGSCTDFVRNNAGYFSEAYWKINYLKVFK